MADEPALPDARAVALIEMACDLARTEADLQAFGAVNASAFQGLDPPTYAAARAVFARRLLQLKGDRSD
ncbi:hypothetical protein CSW62_06505 [Caulobacter sp. FWC2]|nr:hypothetical protein CSW62_06505 [Caulobacter sp. FWC2]